MELTKHEEEFLKHFKKKTLFAGLKIRTKVSILDLCKEGPEIPFSLDKKLVENLSIEFVIS